MVNRMDLAFILCGDDDDDDGSGNDSRSGSGSGGHRGGPHPGDAPICPDKQRPDPSTYNGGLVLTQLPIEVLHHIFKWLPMIDVLEIPRVSSHLRNSFKNHPTFYRDVYLHNLDVPRECDLDWETEVTNLVRIEIACLRRNSAQELDLLFVYNHITSLLRNATSNDPDYQNPPPAQREASSRNLDFLRRLLELDPSITIFMQQSSLFERVHDETVLSFLDTAARDPDPTHIMKQQSAKLHVLCGKPIFHWRDMRWARTYPFACSKVYDMRHYNAATKFGPFLLDGSGFIDWEMVEAILVSLGASCPEEWRETPKCAWETPFHGAWSNSVRLVPTYFDCLSLEARDPYGVAGRWQRMFCYVDLWDYGEFNHMRDMHRDDLEMASFYPVEVPQPRMALDLPGFFRHCFMVLKVTSIDAPGAEDGQDLPVVSFDGRIEKGNAIHSAEPFSDVFFRGTVRLTRENEVHWTTGIVPGGQTRWGSEGVQIGGVRSARGVVGTWFPSNHVLRDPCGPMCYWKISDSTD